MSNSIWKTPDQKPEEDEDIVFMYGSSPITGCYKKNDDTYVEHIGGETFYDNEVERWVYVKDIIAQADKAERLQKAVDLAVETLKFYADGRHYKDEELDLSVYEWYEKEEMGVLVLDDGGRIENGKKARDTIKQLIKDDNNDNTSR